MLTSCVRTVTGCKSLLQLSLRTDLALLSLGQVSSELSYLTHWLAINTGTHSLGQYDCCRFFLVFRDANGQIFHGLRFHDMMNHPQLDNGNPGPCHNIETSSHSKRAATQHGFCQDSQAFLDYCMQADDEAVVLVRDSDPVDTRPGPRLSGSPILPCLT
jgi:hypothetical protein